MAKRLQYLPRIYEYQHPRYNLRSNRHKPTLEHLMMKTLIDGYDLALHVTADGQQHFCLTMRKPINFRELDDEKRFDRRKESIGRSTE